MGFVMTSGRSTIPVFIRYLSRPLSLAIPRWVRAMSTGSGFGQGRNGKFCEAKGPDTRNAGVTADCMLV